MGWKFEGVGKKKSAGCHYPERRLCGERGGTLGGS